MLAVLWDHICTVPGLVAFLQRAARRFDVSSLVIWKRAVVLLLRYGFRPDEIASSGLVNPADAPRDIVFGKHRLTWYQRQYNPIQWECLVEDKAVFYAYCEALRLPVPKVYAVIDRDGGWTAAGVALSTRGEWQRFFEYELPDEFIIKPAGGVYGRGVNLFRREGAAFEDFSGRRFSPAALYKHLQTDSTYSRYVVQERVRNHADIQRLTGTQSLQTARISTWVNKRGNVEIYDVTHKLVLGKNITDNYDSGRSGNISSAVDPHTGTIIALLGPSPDGIGYEALPFHPVTGIKITGKILPDWPATVQLAEKAARLFLPLRTVGWDIALTPRGPVLMEGNAWWDPFNHMHWPEARRRELAQFMRRFTTDS